MTACALALAVSAAGAGLAVGAGTAPTVVTNRGCYLVGQAVHLRGSGFAPRRGYIVTIDGVYFGESRTSSAGAFAATLRPGGLGPGEIEHVEHLAATDGASRATTVFTLTRAAGARFVATGGNPHTLRAPFQVWGFGLDGVNHIVYLHYVSPAGKVRTTIALGHTEGQCGYLKTARRRVFPFSPAAGEWTLQFDTSKVFARRPRGPLARIGVLITNG